MSLVLTLQSEKTETYANSDITISSIGFYGYLYSDIIRQICNQHRITMKGLSYIPALVGKLKSAQPEKIILFGSYAYGEPNENSDLDILVVTNDETIPSSFSEKSKIYLKISSTISDIKKEIPVDLIVHTKAMHQLFIETDSMFAREIQSKGKVLYEKNN